MTIKIKRWVRGKLNSVADFSARILGVMLAYGIILFAVSFFADISFLLDSELSAIEVIGYAFSGAFIGAEISEPAKMLRQPAHLGTRQKKLKEMNDA